MKIKIKVTKDVLRRSMMCGTKHDKVFNVGSNCAIALAVREIMPNAWVTPRNILPFYHEALPNDTLRIVLPSTAKNFIKQFDDYTHNPQDRLLMPEFEFEIELPQSVIDAINIDDIHQSETLELVNN